MDYTKVIDIGSKLSLAVVLMLILYTGSTGYWVFGQQYRDVQSDRDQWKNLALKGTALAQQSVKVGIMGTSPVHNLPSLPTDAKASDVRARLQTLESAIKYKTEPTDEPIQ